MELLERKFPTYFISSDEEIKSENEIHHFNYHEQQKIVTSHFLPQKENVRIILTSGASCPDAEVEKVMNKLLNCFQSVKSTEEVLNQYK